MAAPFGQNVQLDVVAGTITLANVDEFAVHYQVMGTINGGATVFNIVYIQGVAWALCKTDITLPDELENHFYAVHGMTIVELFLIVQQAHNAGFRHGMVLGGNSRAAVCYEIVRNNSSVPQHVSRPQR